MTAWLQYKDAKDLMESVNEERRTVPSKRALVHTCRKWISKLATALIVLPDYLRTHLFRPYEPRVTAHEEMEMELERMYSQRQIPWTIKTAFFATSGACIITSKYGLAGALTHHGIFRLARIEPETLLQIQQASLLDPRKASILAKTITCTRALWFCFLSQGMGISLLELNTWTHCISAFFI